MEDRKPFIHPNYDWIPEGKYTVSKDGRVFVNGDIQCTYHRDRTGLLFIRVSGSCRDTSVTRAFMVLVAHKGLPPTPQHKAHHLDGNPENDHIDNLDWRTEKELAAIRMSKPVHYQRMSELGKSNNKLTEQERQNVLLWFQAGLKAKDIAERLGNKIKPISLYNIKRKSGLFEPKKRVKKDKSEKIKEQKMKLKEKKARLKEKKKRKYTKKIKK